MNVCHPSPTHSTLATSMLVHPQLGILSNSDYFNHSTVFCCACVKLLAYCPGLTTSLFSSFAFCGTIHFYNSITKRLVVFTMCRLALFTIFLFSTRSFCNVIFIALIFFRTTRNQFQTRRLHRRSLRLPTRRKWAHWIFGYYGSGRGRCIYFFALKWGRVLISKNGI